MKKLSLKSGIGESESSILENRDFGNLEKPIRFSFKFCNTDTKKYCIRCLDDQEIEKLYSTLSKFEEITWKQVWQMPHETGFSPEKKDSNNHKMLKSKHDLFSSFLHFRVKGTDCPFRAFAAQQRDLCYILILDRKGKINH